MKGRSVCYNDALVNLMAVFEGLWILFAPLMRFRLAEEGVKSKAQWEEDVHLYIQLRSDLDTICTN
jgi:hypothetical protein